jgi:hypothetical protein
MILSHRALVVGIGPFALATLFVTVAKCYITRNNRRAFQDNRVAFPAISELGVDGPEHRFYQVGFALIGLALFVHVGHWHTLVAPHLEADARTTDGAHVTPATVLRGGRLSAVGCLLQGLFTLDLTLSPQSIVHWSGAVAFLMGAMQFSEGAKALYAATAAADGAQGAANGGVPFIQRPRVQSAEAFRRDVCDRLMMGVFLVPILMQMYRSAWPPTVNDAAAEDEELEALLREPPVPPVAPADPDARGPAFDAELRAFRERKRVHDARVACLRELKQERDKPRPSVLLMNVMGAVQWLIILQMAVLLCSFSADIGEALALRGA